MDSSNKTMLALFVIIMLVCFCFFCLLILAIGYYVYNDNTPRTKPNYDNILNNLIYPNY